MSFIYPRLISIVRPGAQSGYGALPYGGQLPQTETPVLGSVSASIQLLKVKQHNEAGLPGDAEKSVWQILFRHPKAGVVTQRDVVIDDAGKRYQVQAAYWNSLGYRLEAELLEA